jgi:polyketide cyclase/dehydrase/lipid transport protein
MKGIATATLVIKAHQARVYAILADYRDGHPKILPMKYFKRLDVLEGGTGAGTRVRGEILVFGRTIKFEHTVSEPEPGRVLVESDVTGSSVTQFTVDAVNGGAASRVTTHTQFTTEREGLLGRIERLATTATLERIYNEELAQLADYAVRATVA